MRNENNNVSKDNTAIKYCNNYLKESYKTQSKIILSTVIIEYRRIFAGIFQGYGLVRSRFPLRGGNYNNTSSAGLAALNLNNRRANVNSNIGLRPALPPSQMSGLHGGLSSAEGKRSRIPSLLSKDGKENMNRQGRLVGTCPYGAAEYRPCPPSGAGIG
jgi:hypothetical protein